jgi:hypothetical protein
MGAEKSIPNFWPENVKERDLSEDLVVDGTIILEWISGK